MGGDRKPQGRGAVAVGNVLFGDDEAVGRWVADRIPGFRMGDEARALGVIRNDRIVAGVVFENWNGIHVEAAIAADPGARWASRSTLCALFSYPFNTLKCLAISVSVPSSNVLSLKLATGLGFEPEALIKYAAHDGSSLCIMKMFRDRCRWIANPAGASGAS